MRLTAKRPPSTCGVMASMTARARPSAGNASTLRAPCLRAAMSRPAEFEENRRERRQRQRQRVEAAVRTDRHRMHTAEIAHPAAAVERGVAVQHLAPESGFGNADGVIDARHRRKIARYQHRCTTARTPEERDDA